MRVNTMRFVDKYAGVPLTFFATIIKKLFLGKDSGRKPKKILFIELSEMGSAILADPAMQKAKKMFDAELFFLIFKSNKASLKFLNTIDDNHIFTIDARNFVSLAVDSCKFLKWTREKNIDTVVDLELFSRFTALLSGLSGAYNTVGFHTFHAEGLYRGSMLTHKVLYNPHIHIAKNFISLVNSLNESVSTTPHSKMVINDDEIELRKTKIDDKSLEKVKKLIKNDTLRIVLINPNASEMLPERRWSHDKYLQLIELILEKYDDVLILITGARNEAKEAETLTLKINNDRCINFAGKLKITDLTALYSISTLMVTNDSGPNHFASVTDMPTITIYGPETPKLYGSLGDSTSIYKKIACSPCVNAFNHRKTICNNNICLQMITVEEVMEAVEERLKK